MKNEASSKKKSKLLLIPLAILLIFAIVLNAAAVMLKSTFDQFLGAGAKTVVGGSDLAGDYYTLKYADGDAARDAGYAVAARVNEEGTVLLKNNGVLPLASDAEVMPFGYSFRFPIYGQSSSSGSAKWADEPITLRSALFDSSLNLNETALNTIFQSGKPLKLAEATGTNKAAGSSALGGDFTITEFDPAGYSSVEPAPNATGLVVVSRGGQEGSDVKSDAYADGTPHYLALTEYERGMIREAKRICKNVILLINSSALWR